MNQEHAKRKDTSQRQTPLGGLASLGYVSRAGSPCEGTGFCVVPRRMGTCLCHVTTNGVVFKIGCSAGSARPNPVYQPQRPAAPRSSSSLAFFGVL